MNADFQDFKYAIALKQFLFCCFVFLSAGIGEKLRPK